MLIELVLQDFSEDLDFYGLAAVFLDGADEAKGPLQSQLLQAVLATEERVQELLGRLVALVLLEVFVVVSTFLVHYLLD